MIISGATGSGKSTWIYNFLQNIDDMYTDQSPEKVLYCYGIYQDLFIDMERNCPRLSFHQGIPTREEMEDFTANGKHNLIVLDDLMHVVVDNAEMELLFTQGCHHRKLSVIFVTQQLFYQGKKARTIALNTWYMVLLKNLRNVAQVSTLGRQLFPGKGNALANAYQDCLKTPYGYLVVDMAPNTNDLYRLRTNVFPGEDPLIYSAL